MSGRCNTPQQAPWRKFVAQLRERNDPLCDQAAREIESCRETILELQQEIRDTARGAADEATWRAIQGEDYGSY